MVDKKNKAVKVDATPSKKEVVKNSTEKKETKSESFLRIAEPRVKSVLRAIRILGNCSNRTNYEYTQEQTEKIYMSIQENLDNMFAKFTPSNTEQETFKF